MFHRLLRALDPAWIPSMEEVRITLPEVVLPGLLLVPESAQGAVLFAHGSGSSRLSPRNQAVAQALTEASLASLLFDLLTPDEAADRRLVFDISLLARRLSQATDWLERRLALPIGYFGASTGAAAALVAAAERGPDVQAVVSRGGRPDLAGPYLPRVTAPTLLIVGSLDLQVLELNRMAQSQMKAPVELQVVEGASHLFEEPGTLDAVSDLARDWLRRHLARTD